jgi:hypothetical protein
MKEGMVALMEAQDYQDMDISVKVEVSHSPHFLLSELCIT